MVGTKRTGIRGIDRRERRTIERNPAGLSEAAQPAGSLLQQETEKHEGCFLDVHSQLQRLLADSDVRQAGDETAD